MLLPNLVVSLTELLAIWRSFRLNILNGPRSTITHRRGTGNPTWTLLPMNTSPSVWLNELRTEKKNAAGKTLSNDARGELWVKSWEWPRLDIEYPSVEWLLTKGGHRDCVCQTIVRSDPSLLLVAAHSIILRAGRDVFLLSWVGSTAQVRSLHVGSTDLRVIVDCAANMVRTLYSYAKQ